MTYKPNEPLVLPPAAWAVSKIQRPGVGIELGAVVYERRTDRLRVVVSDRALHESIKRVVSISVPHGKPTDGQLREVKRLFLRRDVPYTTDFGMVKKSTVFYRQFVVGEPVEEDDLGLLQVDQMIIRAIIARPDVVDFLFEFPGVPDRKVRLDEVDGGWRYAVHVEGVTSGWVRSTRSWQNRAIAAASAATKIGALMAGVERDTDREIPFGEAITSEN